MSRLEKIKSIIKQNKSILSKKYKVKEIGIFGSFVRNEQKNNSDIDVLVEFSEPVGFFDFLDLEEELKQMLGNKIDDFQNPAAWVTAIHKVRNNKKEYCRLSELAKKNAEKFNIEKKDNVLLNLLS